MKVTVVTAVYNGAHTIAGALTSVLEQDHADIELLVVDGGSTDGTQARVRAIDDPRLHMTSEPDQGIYDALNKGIARATGDILGFVHADDLLARSDVLSRIVATFEAEECDLSYGDLDYVTAADTTRVIRRWRAGAFAPARLKWGWMPPHPTVYARRTLYDRVGPFDTSYRIAADYEAMLRMFAIPELRAAYIPETLVTMRLGGVSNRNLTQVRRKSLEDLRAVRNNGIGGLPTIAAKNLRKLPQFIRR